MKIYYKKNIFKFYTLVIISIIFSFSDYSFAQLEDQEQILYYQMEPLDDSLFIKIQTEVFIDPPDPKAEMIVDLRDPNNQTLSIKGALYPFLAFTPETRARIQTFPFKINLEEDIHFASVFTRVIEKMRLGKLAAPPTLYQISPTLHYVNPFLQLLGGERFGIPLKDDIGISFGAGTPYSGTLETNFVEASFHILGFWGGIFNSIDAITEVLGSNRHNNLYVTSGYQLGYVIPFGNFFQISYFSPFESPTQGQILKWQRNNTEEDQVKIVDKSYFNWEFRYPVSILGSTRGKVYAASFLGEMHVGYTGRELSLAGSTFDFRFDAMFNSDVRNNQYVAEIMVQKIFDSWAFSAFALGPSAVLSKNETGTFSVITVFVNVRVKVGTSL
jgi:hypothetical protein